MTSGPNIAVELTVDSSQYNAGLQKATTKTNEFTSNIKKQGTRWKNAGFIEISRGVEDFASQLGTTGLAGAMRASANNASQLLALWGPAGLAGMAASLGVTLGSILIPKLLETRDALKEITDLQKETMGHHEKQRARDFRTQQERDRIKTPEDRKAFIADQTSKIKELESKLAVPATARKLALDSFIEEKRRERAPRQEHYAGFAGGIDRQLRHMARQAGPAFDAGPAITEFDQSGQGKEFNKQISALMSDIAYHKNQLAEETGTQRGHREWDQMMPKIVSPTGIPKGIESRISKPGSSSPGPPLHVPLNDMIEEQKEANNTLKDIKKAMQGDKTMGQALVIPTLD